MADKLLVEVDMVNGDTEDAVRALVFLANEIVESSTIEITDTPKWRERTNSVYQMKWRFAEDTISSWQLSIGVDLAVQINHALRTAKTALNKRPKRGEVTTGEALQAIEKVQAALLSYMTEIEPELCELISE